MFSFLNNLINPEKLWHIKCLDGDYTYEQLNKLDDNLWDFISSDTTMDYEFAKKFEHKINWTIADKKILTSIVQNASVGQTPKTDNKSLVRVPNMDNPEEELYINKDEVNDYIKKIYPDDEPPNILELVLMFRQREFNARQFINSRCNISKDSVSKDSITKNSIEKGYYFAHKTILPTKYYDKTSNGLIDVCRFIVDDYKDDEILGMENLEQNQENVLNFKTILRLNQIFCTGSFSREDFIQYCDVIDFKHIMTCDMYDNFMDIENVNECIKVYKNICDEIIKKYNMEKEITIQKMFVSNQPVTKKVDMNSTFEEVDEDNFWEYYHNR